MTGTDPTRGVHGVEAEAEAKIPGEQALAAVLDELAAAIRADAEPVFEAMAARLAATHTALDPDAARGEDRRLLVEGVVVALALRRRDLAVALYADLGEPPAAEAFGVYRRLLAMEPGADGGVVRIGMHPRSQRLLAAIELPLLSLRLQPELADAALEQLIRRVRQVQAQS